MLDASEDGVGVDATSFLGHIDVLTASETSEHHAALLISKKYGLRPRNRSRSTLCKHPAIQIYGVQEVQLIEASSKRFSPPSQLQNRGCFRENRAEATIPPPFQHQEHGQSLRLRFHLDLRCVASSLHALLLHVVFGLSLRGAFLAFSVRLFCFLVVKIPLFFSWALAHFLF